MTAADWELNLFRSDPELLERSADATYVTAAEGLGALADPKRLLLLHALSVGEDTPQRAAVWSGLTQADAERELAAMTLLGMVERRDGPRYLPRDGHYVVQLQVALAHGREAANEQHPRLLARRRRARVGATQRAG